MSSINTHILESLLDALGGEQQVLADIINCYLVESPKIVVAIQTSVTSENAGTLDKTAHKLKSSSASLGAIDLSRLCLELELKGKSDNLEGVLELLSRLINEYAQVEIALKKIVEVP
ncbi:MAG: Hpt domain-containing protein [Nostocales cyanobacterium ELA583]|jgi:HPt (histidine-containing phosphotransfer) domain-containing protein